MQQHEVHNSYWVQKQVALFLHVKYYSSHHRLRNPSSELFIPVHIYTSTAACTQLVSNVHEYLYCTADTKNMSNMLCISQHCIQQT